MTTLVELYNMSISHLGIGQEVATETERSQEAKACQRFWDVCRQATLRDFKWPFARKVATLALIEENPNDNWSYSYRYPTDCVGGERIVNGSRNEDRQSLVTFDIGKDDAGLTVLTDQSNAVLEYTMDVSDLTTWPPDAILAASFRLASLICPRLTKGDPFKIKSEMLGQYDLEISRAKANALNEQVKPEMPESQFIRVRE